MVYQGTVLLYCNNDACPVRPTRYESEFMPKVCSECKAPLENSPPRRETHIQGPRTFNTY